MKIALRRLAGAVVGDEDVLPFAGGDDGVALVVTLMASSGQASTRWTRWRGRMEKVPAAIAAFFVHAGDDAAGDAVAAGGPRLRS
jgi:hypothetical protein